MNKESALDFLRRHQPMPADENMFDDSGLLDEYDEVRRYFQAQPALEAVPLFLNSFGEGSGFGVYQLVEEAITPLPVEDVVPYLISALSSGSRSIRYWSADIALNFSSPQLVPPLKQMLEHDDPDGRSAAASALAFIPGQVVSDTLRQALDHEQDSYVRDFITQVLEDRVSRVE